MERKNRKESISYLIFIHFLYFSVVTCGGQGNPKSEIFPGFFSNSSPTEERNWQTPTNPPASQPIIPVPDGFGSSGPEVRFGFLPASVDRYRPLELVFSEKPNQIPDPNSFKSALIDYLRKKPSMIIFKESTTVQSVQKNSFFKPSRDLKSPNFV